MQTAQQEQALPFLGSDLRSLRQRRAWSLAEVALKLGRSVGFLSQIERGLSEPSIEDLKRLANLYEVPLSLLFHNAEGDPNEAGHIVRADARRQLGSPETGIVEQLLSPSLGGAFEIIHSVFSPGALKEKTEERETEEAGYVISGTFDIEIGGSWHSLGPGDSFRFANEPYRWRNPGSIDAIVIWVIAPPVY